MMRSRALLVGACLAVSATPALAAITYTGSSTVGSAGSYSLSVTTDGATGALSTSDITDWLITISDSHGTFTLTPLDSQVQIGGSALSATPTDLTFDFAGSGYALFQNPAIGSSANFLCFAGQVCGNYSDAINLLVGTDFPAGVSTSPMSGSVIIASAISGAVPEPATWAMMLVGFGAVGFAMRKRKSAIALAQLA